ncbi:hypothetical protein NPIL_446651 [Nephila pilipes]|uniref:Uncharacterized protein n=1 Tax=Nephila pilipes TaxID=299642 RepID=A0A8X6TZA2_NEPPI|nr:hypothetical protein NPIL_446651 [Nephila pilipes]
MTTEFSTTLLLKQNGGDGRKLFCADRTERLVPNILCTPIAWMLLVIVCHMTFDFIFWLIRVSTPRYPIYLSRWVFRGLPFLGCFINDTKDTAVTSAGRTSTTTPFPDSSSEYSHRGLTITKLNDAHVSKIRLVIEFKTKWCSHQIIVSLEATTGYAGPVDSTESFNGLVRLVVPGQASIGTVLSVRHLYEIVWSRIHAFRSWPSTEMFVETFKQH